VGARHGRAVLIVTHARDDHVPLVAGALAARGADAVRFDTDGYPARARVGFAISRGIPEVRFSLPGRELRGDEVGAVLYRHRVLPDAPAGMDEEAAPLVRSELQGALDGALLALDATWVNHPHANRLARHKLLQLRLARAEGLRVPETTVSADPEEIRARFRGWGGRMVAKLAGGQLPLTADVEAYAIYTTRVEAGDLADDAALAACPAMYQEEIGKAHELRVTVVGDEVLACRIDSPGVEAARVDWRAAGRDAVPHSAVELDAALADRCRALTRRLGLRMAGLDLIVTPEGEPVFLELNAAGQWAWIEEATGLPIAAAIAGELLAGVHG